MAETFEEWRVTGHSGDGWPVYDFVWSPDANPHLGDPETAARNFVALIGANGRPGWEDGPHLSKRTVTRTDWEPAGAGHAGNRPQTAAAGRTAPPEGSAKGGRHSGAQEAQG